MDPSITFAIPFYSNFAYLRKAIESVLCQSDGSWTILVCDDGHEKDETESLVTSLRDERIRYHRNERRLGMAANWNRCLDLAETDLVTLLHADDELLPNYTVLMRRESARYPQAAALFCNAEVIDGNGQRRFSLPEQVKKVLNPAKQSILELNSRSAVKALLRGNFIMCPTLCFRKSVLGQRRFAEHWKMVQDLELTTRLLLDGETLVGLPENGYRYRRHGRNATDQYTRELLRFREESDLYALLAQEAAHRGWNDVARLARRKAIIKLNLSWCLLKDVSCCRIGHAVNKVRFLGQLVSG